VATAQYLIENWCTNIKWIAHKQEKKSTQNQFNVHGQGEKRKQKEPERAIYHEASVSSHTPNRISHLLPNDVILISLVMQSHSLICNKPCDITSLKATPATPLLFKQLSSTSPNIPQLLICTLYSINNQLIEKVAKMPLFKHKEKNRPDLTNEQGGNPVIGQPQPQHQHNNSYHDSTYYSNSNSSTMDSRVQQPPPQQNQNHDGQRPGTTVTTTTTTTTSKSFHSSYSEFSSSINC
jgi:hypothetical protein